MTRPTRRLLLLILSIPVGLFALAVIYQQGMTHLEGEPRTLAASIEWASETITTTGYGADSQWSHPFMQTFVVVVQFLGLFLVFLIFPIFVIPFFEERFEGRLPMTLPPLEDHVVIYRWGPEVSSLVEDLDRAGVPVVVFEEDAETARRLHDRGRAVTFGRIDEDEPDLRTLVKARGLVVNGSDHENAVFVMSARQQGYTGNVVALCANPKRRRAMSRAGADAVFTPSHALAAAMAARTSARITPRVSGAPMLGDQVVVDQVRVDPNSPLAGKTLAEAKIGARTGTSVLGCWREGELMEANAATRLEPGSILVAAGAHDQMEALAELLTPVPRTGPLVICGYGEVGRKVAQLLGDAGEELVVIDLDAADSVDVVGDALDPDVLTRAGVADAQAVLLCLGDDSETVFATALIRDLAPEVIITAAAERASSLPRIRRAGADFGFSVGQVAGQLMSYHLLGEKSLSLQSKIKIARVEPGRLAGHRLVDGNVRGRTGCSVVAIERRGSHVEIDDRTVVERNDAVYISGAVDAVERYKQVFEIG